MDPAAFSAFTQGLLDIQTLKYTQLASSVIIIFDHLITLGQEVELIWQSTWTLGKILFLLNRYYALGGIVFNNYAIFRHTVDESVCMALYRWQGWTGLIACMLAEAILQMRLYALYSLSKKFLAFILTCWIACLTISGYVMYTSLAVLTTTPIVIPGGMFCLANNISPHFYVFWIPMLSFEFLLCLLAVIRGFQTYRSNGSLFRTGRKLVGILIRDSVVYFFVICATYLTCLLIWILAPVNLIGVPIGFALAMSCVLTNRVVLNVRSINRDLKESRLPTVNIDKVTSIEDAIINLPPTPASLTSFEMAQLRTMRAEKNLSSEVIDSYEPEDLPFVVL
ncbi:hypothetical protein BDN70DRAFT_348524 [Pholiota conissans]|uniref:DUF6533 domain-containing protein n=1 Tax=Pholiota conissans TaxID=109636 RepID=A0A9P6CUI6_9AGAR|nr:hypothetical protein BDN70DRAFT_348524 [Pholiota conissans]